MKLIRYLLIMTLLSPVSAFADSVSYGLTVPDTKLSSSPGPYGTVDLVLNSNGTIGVTVTMASGYLIGGGGNAFGFNLGSPSLIASDITASGLPNGWSCCNTGQQMNGFGGFAFAIVGSSASQGLSTLGFTVSTSQFGSTGFTSVSQLIGLSSGNAGEGNQDFAAHVIPLDGSPTGYAGSNAPVPELGGFASLLSSCLGGFGGLSLVKRRRKQSLPSS